MGIRIYPFTQSSSVDPFESVMTAPPQPIEYSHNPEIYHSITASSQYIWEAKFDEAQSVLTEHTSTSLSASLARAEVMIWIYSLDNTEESLNAAIACFDKLEEEATEFMNRSKPSGVLSSIVSVVLI